MLVNKIELIPTLFDGIEEITHTNAAEISTEYIINNRIDTYSTLGHIYRGGVQFVQNPAHNLLNLYSNEVGGYYATKHFKISNDFKIDQKYLNKILSVIEQKWDEQAAKIAIGTGVLSFHEMQKIVKNKNNTVIRSWEELDKENLYGILEFSHIKENVTIIKSLFLYYLTGEDIYKNRKSINMIQSNMLTATINKDGFIAYNGSGAIDKFECVIDRRSYLCDYNGTTVTMYPNIKDLMDEKEVNGFKNIGKSIFNSEDLIIKTNISKLNPYNVLITFDSYSKMFKRGKATSSLVMRGISSESFDINLSFTAEDVKSILAKFGYKKVGLKQEVMERLGQLCQDLAIQHEEKLANYFNSNMVIKFNHSNSHVVNVKIEGIDDSIVHLVAYVYIKNRIHGGALFLKDKVNGLYNASNDFAKKNERITIQYMRVNEGIA